MRLLLLLAVLLVGSTSWAQHARPKDKGQGYAQAGRPVDGGGQVFATENVAHPINLSDDVGAAVRPACFAFEGLVTFAAVGGAGSCVYAQTSTLTFKGDFLSARACVVGTIGPDGRGNCFHLPAAGASRDAVPGFDAVYRAPGARSGICSAPTIGPGRKMVYPPCRVDGDCTDAVGSGTCNTSPTDAQRAQSCAFVVCQVDTASTLITWTMEE